MARHTVILYTALDYNGEQWDIREERKTRNGWNIMLGWPSDLPRGVGAGGPRVMIDKNLKEYLDEYRFDPGLMDLPISETVIKRIRKLCGHHRYKDRPLWWNTRKDDLLTMTLEQFCKKHNCSIGAASQMRNKYKKT